MLIYSCYGFEFIKFDCHRIFYTAENVRPNYKECDFSLSFDYDDYDEKNFRFPLYLFSYLKYLEKGNELDVYHQPKEKFCNMVVSNPKGAERNSFFDLLTSKKKVDSGGSFMNNMGGRVEDKMQFISNYRFTFAFENSSWPGYTTEKLVQPMLAGSIPIYWGNPRIHEEFNSKSFINIHEFASFESAIDMILEIEENQAMYEEMVDQPWLINNSPLQTQNYDWLRGKLREIVEQVLNSKPIAMRARFYPIYNIYRKKIVHKITKKPVWYC